MFNEHFCRQDVKKETPAWDQVYLNQVSDCIVCVHVFKIDAGHWNLNQKSSISNVETQEGKSFESTRRVTDRAISQRVTRSHEMREEWGGAEKSVEHRPTSGGRDDSSRG